MKRISIYELVVMAIMTAIAVVGQVAIAVLPNIEIVTLLFIVYTLILGPKVFIVIYAFVLLEGLLHGFGLWWINYLYVWSVLAGITMFFRKQTSILFWSILSGIYGLTFGTLCSIPYFITGGWAAGFAYIVQGIPYDLIHCIGNVVVCLILYKPLRYVIEKGMKNL